MIATGHLGDAVASFVAATGGSPDVIEGLRRTPAGQTHEVSHKVSPDALASRLREGFGETERG
ncbi:MAG TPA: hypothetical protein HA263_02915 [Methanoregulaceae archaeon]|nr:hypothetical protein [Methanoregulaceae archaeon]